jgi:hypothetical protein
MAVPPADRTTLRRFLLLLLCISAVAAAAACKRSGGTLTREQFVRANVALREVTDSGPRADSLRAAALKKAGVTPEQLRAFVRANAMRTDVLAKAWGAIDDSVQTFHQKRLDANPAIRGEARPPTPLGAIGSPGAAIAGPTGGMPNRKAEPSAPPAHGAPRQEVPIGVAPPPAPPGPEGMRPAAGRVVPKRAPPTTNAPRPPATRPDTARPPV